MADDDSDWSFAELDALLEQALALDDDEALKAFLAGLEPGRRTALLHLLRQGESDSFSRIADWVKSALPPAAPPSTTGEQRAGSWSLKHEIGSGGTGRVFYAERRESGSGPEGDRDQRAEFSQKAAVKILWSYRISSQFKQRFYRERRILASIDHPGIARFLDGGLLGDGRPWFAMEYVEGVDIVHYARSLSTAERLNLFLGVCVALEYAHQRLIVHRDIKPQNVLVDTSGRPRLLDFGIARLLGDEADEGLTRADGTPLTLRYASPEQVTGKAVDVASDVYQLGMLLYLMLTGRDAYDLSDCSLQQAIQIICERIPPPPSACAAGISSDLDAIVGHALNKSPSGRYASAAAFADDLRRYLDGRPVLARPHSAWYVAQRFVQRHAVLVGVIAGSALLLSGATLFSIDRARDAQEEAERSRKTQQILADVFQQADPFGRPGADVTLGDALERRFDPIAEQVQRDPELALQVFPLLGKLFSQLGRYDQSERAYQRALEATSESPNAFRSQRLAAAQGIAAALNAQGRFRETLAFVDALPGTTPRDRETARLSAFLLLNETEAQLATGNIEAAAQRLDEVQDLVSRFGLDDPELLYRQHVELANAAREALDLTAATEHSRQAAAYAGEAGLQWARAVNLQNVAIYMGRDGRLEDAEPYFLEAMAIIDQYAPGHPGKLELSTNYAGWLFRTDRLEASVALLQDTIATLDGTPDRHLWAYANRDLAFYSFATGDIAASVLANRQALLVAADLYGVDSPRIGALMVTLARHLSLAGLHAASLAVMQRTLAANPSIGAFDLAPYLAELRLDAGEIEAARADYVPEARPEDAFATVLGLKFACALDHREALAARLDAIDPAGLGDSVPERRLRAWHGLMVAALARAAGEDPRPGLVTAWDTLANTPRLSTLEEWRLLRELVPLYASLGAMPAAVESAWSDVLEQRETARELLVNDYLPADSTISEGIPIGEFTRRDPPPLDCLR